MAQPNIALREPTFEAVQINELIGPVYVDADEHYLRQATFGVDDYSTWYTISDPRFGALLVPQSMIARDLVALFCSVYDPSRVVGLHQKEEVWFHNPIKLGTRMAYTGRYTDKYEKRGKGYVVFECEARDAINNDLLVRQISTEIMRIPKNVKLGEGSSKPEGERVNPVWPKEHAPVARARRDLPIGTPVAPLTKSAHQDQMSVFSGCGQQWYNIHTDVEVAHKAGFRDTLAQGMMETCWVSEMLSKFFGVSWLSTGWIKMAYIRPVFRNDIITCRAVIRDVVQHGGKTRMKFDVWTENQDGVIPALGWASGIMD